MAVPKVCKLAPFGNFSRRHNADTAAKIESGQNALPFGFAKIRSRSAR